MQHNYRYFFSEPIGKSFDPEFRSDLTSKQMLWLGVFDGKYMTDCTTEFASDWFAGAKLNPNFYNPDLNFFGINASGPLSYWGAKGWIYLEDSRTGFSGIVDTIWVGRIPEKDICRVKQHWKAMRHHVLQLQKKLSPEWSQVYHDSVRLCCIGPMIVVSRKIC